jgi:restriction system protein
MRRRKSDSVAEDLVFSFAELPWWGGLIGVLVGAGIVVIVPAILGPRSIGAPFAALAGWLFGGIALVGGLIGVRKRWERRRLLDRQRGMETIRSLSWIEFEQLLGEAYRRRGYRVIETGGGGADGGYDLDLRGADGRVLVQCKHWLNRQVGVREVRELAGVLAGERADRGIFVTTGTFTATAVDFAATALIELVDGLGLERLLDGVAATPAEVPVENKLVPTCPRCGSRMVRRVATRGPRPGSAFWGCSNYPTCRATMEAA